jgi:hypothetical protein
MDFENVPLFSPITGPNPQAPFFFPIPGGLPTLDFPMEGSFGDLDILTDPEPN